METKELLFVLKTTAEESENNDQQQFQQLHDRLQHADQELQKARKDAFDALREDLTKRGLTPLTDGAGNLMTNGAGRIMTV